MKPNLPSRSCSALASSEHCGLMPSAYSRQPNPSDGPCENLAERLLRLGKLLLFLLRHGAEPTQMAQELGIGSGVCRLATAFATSSDCLKLRALVEDWKLSKIRTELKAVGSLVGRRQ